MEKTLTELFNIIALAGICCVPFLKSKGKGIVTFIVIILQVIVASFIALSVFYEGAINFSYPGSFVTGIIPVRVDELSAWFILIISFGFLTGGWYGLKYMSMYLNDDQENKGNLSLHAIAFILAFTSLIDICIVQNGFIFLVFWEIMALSSFILIIYEHYKIRTLKAGLNFLIQSHISILFLTLAFMIARVKTGTFDFNGIVEFSSKVLNSNVDPGYFVADQSTVIIIALLIFFFSGFAIKAGFAPFHTWLPLAHPAAPSHISGIMSGVIIKIGIYGILRMLLLIEMNTALTIAVGYTILAISVITGVYGVMMAIIQHNLKKLLAYHSIENIGIIGIGIGAGCLGIGYGNVVLMAGGFGGALLHTLNHSLFKSLLFYTAGNVYKATHTMQIESLGGLLKKMPHTAYLFLIAALAICGLPPFNGFISEFLIYNGLFNGLISSNFFFIIFILFVILGLVLIGGLALICFTKAFGIVFLGTPREAIKHEIPQEKTVSNLPLYLIASVILLIGIFPFILQPVLIPLVGMFGGLPEQMQILNTDPSIMNNLSQVLGSLTNVGWYSLAFIGLVVVLFIVRHLVTRKRSVLADETWGCGYVGDASKMQYTASSFIRTYRKLAEPLLMVHKEKAFPEGLYPEKIEQITHPYDKAEHWLIDKPLALMRRFLNRFVFLQNGNIQFYILYGFIFIGLVIVLPLIIRQVMMLINFLNQL